MRFVFTRDVEEFASHAEVLLQSQIECNVLATVLIGARQGIYEGGLFAYAPGEDGGAIAAALRTPPWPLLCSPLAPSAIADLLGLWLEHDPDLRGVVGLPGTARGVSAEWERLTGRRSRPGMQQAMHVLEKVTEPSRPSAGSLRPATATDQALVSDWMRAFVLETRIAEGEQAERMADAALRRGGLLLWEDGEVASMVGFQPRVAGVVRVGPVYTPPALRARGYASSAVAAASSRMLAEGADRCMLFTDLANPTSNKIYAAIGYRRIAEWEEHVFEAPQTGPTA